MDMRWLAGLALLLCAATAWGTESARDDVREARAEMVRSAREYRASLEPLLALQADAAARAAATAARRRELLARGIVSPREAEESERAAAAARETLERTRARVAEAGALLAEAEVARQLAALPEPRGGEAAPALIRYTGSAEWSLALAPRLEAFFARRFGRPLPVSALGQTPLHDRLGFDHRDALDVAVHPDTPEGEALMTWLRQRGLSFLAFRGAVAGEATGAHLHIGDPSPRLAARPR